MKVLLSVLFVASMLALVITSKPGEQEGVEYTPWYVPPQKFSITANQRVILDPMIGPNTLVNSRELCGSNGITQSETSIAAFADIVVVAFNDSRGFACPGRRRSTVGWAYSVDGGRTFTDGGTLPGGQTAWSNGDPALAVGPDGTFYVAGIGNNFHAMSFSRGTLEGNRIIWSEPVSAVTGPGIIDKELLAVDQTTGTIYMAYVRSQVVEVIHSKNQGATWSGPVQLGTPGIGAFPIVAPDSTLYVAWLEPSAVQRIVVSRSDDRAETFTKPVMVSRVCPISVPGFNRGQMPAFPMADVDWGESDTNGRVYVAFHSSCSSNGDVFLTWSDDGAQTWIEPVKVNDDKTNAIHFSPSVSVDDSSYINVVFYDRRDKPGTGITNFYFSQSTDGGNTFSPNIRVTDVSTNWLATQADLSPNFGDYAASISDGTDVLLTWADGREGDPDVYFARISPKIK